MGLPLRRQRAFTAMYRCLTPSPLTRNMQPDSLDCWSLKSLSAIQTVLYRRPSRIATTLFLFAVHLLRAQEANDASVDTKAGHAPFVFAGVRINGISSERANRLPVRIPAMAKLVEFNINPASESEQHTRWPRRGRFRLAGCRSVDARHSQI